MMIWDVFDFENTKKNADPWKNGMCYKLCVICKKQYVYSIIRLKDNNTVLFACWNKDRLRVMVKYSEAPKTNQNVVNLFSLQSIKVVKKLFIFFVIVYMTDSCPLPHPPSCLYVHLISATQSTLRTVLLSMYDIFLTWLGVMMGNHWSPLTDVKFSIYFQRGEAHWHNKPSTTFPPSQDLEPWRQSWTLYKIKLEHFFHT